MHDARNYQKTGTDSCVLCKRPLTDTGRLEEHDYLVVLFRLASFSHRLPSVPFSYLQPQQHRPYCIGSIFRLSLTSKTYFQSCSTLWPQSSDPRKPTTVQVQNGVKFKKKLCVGKRSRERIKCSGCRTWKRSSLLRKKIAVQKSTQQLAWFFDVWPAEKKLFYFVQLNCCVCAEKARSASSLSSFFCLTSPSRQSFGYCRFDSGRVPHGPVASNRGWKKLWPGAHNGKLVAGLCWRPSLGVLVFGAVCRGNGFPWPSHRCIYCCTLNMLEAWNPGSSFSFTCCSSYWNWREIAG